VVATEESSSGIVVPQALFELAHRIGDFTFRKVKSEFIVNSSALKSPADWKNGAVQ